MCVFQASLSLSEASMGERWPLFCCLAILLEGAYLSDKASRWNAAREPRVQLLVKHVQIRNRKRRGRHDNTVLYQTTVDEGKDVE